MPADPTVIDRFADPLLPIFSLLGLIGLVGIALLVVGVWLWIEGK